MRGAAASLRRLSFYIYRALPFQVAGPVAPPGSALLGREAAGVSGEAARSRLWKCSPGFASAAGELRAEQAAGKGGRSRFVAGPLVTLQAAGAEGPSLGGGGLPPGRQSPRPRSGG